MKNGKNQKIDNLLGILASTGEVSRAEVTFVNNICPPCTTRSEFSESLKHRHQNLLQGKVFN